METTKACLVTFFVPCLNEEGNVGRTIDNIVKMAGELEYSHEILIVDDASVDGTIAETLESQLRHPRTWIEVIQNPFCRGLGRNYFIAAQRARGEYFMLINGDAAEPPESIRRILSHLAEADAVIPFFGLAETRTLPRRALSRAFTFLVNTFSGHCLKYYNGPVLHKTENVRMWFSETAGFAYQAELLCRLLDEGISVVEVQVSNSTRERGISKAFTITNLLSVGNALFHILLRRLERLAFTLLAPSKRRPHGRQHQP